MLAPWISAISWTTPWIYPYGATRDASLGTSSGEPRGSNASTRFRSWSVWCTDPETYSSILPCCHGLAGPTGCTSTGHFSATNCHCVWISVLYPEALVVLHICLDLQGMKTLWEGGVCKVPKVFMPPRTALQENDCKSCVKPHWTYTHPGVPGRIWAVDLQMVVSQQALSSAWRVPLECFWIARWIRFVAMFEHLWHHVRCKWFTSKTEIRILFPQAEIRDKWRASKGEHDYIIICSVFPSCWKGKSRCYPFPETINLGDASCFSQDATPSRDATPHWEPWEGHHRWQTYHVYVRWEHIWSHATPFWSHHCMVSTEHH